MDKLSKTNQKSGLSRRKFFKYVGLGALVVGGSAVGNYLTPSCQPSNPQITAALRTATETATVTETATATETTALTSYACDTMLSTSTAIASCTRDPVDFTYRVPKSATSMDMTKLSLDLTEKGLQNALREETILYENSTRVKALMRSVTYRQITDSGYELALFFIPDNPKHFLKDCDFVLQQFLETNKNCPVSSVNHYGRETTWEYITEAEDVSKTDPGVIRVINCRKQGRVAGDTQWNRIPMPNMCNAQWPSFAYLKDGVIVVQTKLREDYYNPKRIDGIYFVEDVGLKNENYGMDVSRASYDDPKLWREDDLGKYSEMVFA